MTISCWGNEEAQAIIGTEVEYSSQLFRWKDQTVHMPIVDVRTVTARQFHDENSGSGSQVTFRQLGIPTEKVQAFVVHHSPANLTGATIEIPGDSVLVKGPNLIVFPVCNVYFEAVRKTASRR